jgi:hypothetical protein
LVDLVFRLEGSEEGLRSRLLIEGTISAKDVIVAVGELDRSFVIKTDRKRKII